MERKTGVLVFTHGSRVAAGNEIMMQFVARLRARLGDQPVEACFMELGQPDIPTAIDKLIADGCTHIFGYALFLVPGRHLQEDIPSIINTALKKHPGVTYEVTAPMLDDPALLDLVERRIQQAI